MLVLSEKHSRSGILRLLKVGVTMHWELGWKNWRLGKMGRHSVFVR